MSIQRPHLNIAAVCIRYYPRKFGSFANPRFDEEKAPRARFTEKRVILIKLE